MSKIYDQLMKNGWSPVPYKHLPYHLKETIKKANFRPQAKQCFRNSQRIVSNWHNVHGFRYVEGIVKSSIPIIHSWVIDKDGTHYDVTLNPEPEILCYKIYDRDAVIKNMSKTLHFCPINYEWLNLMQTAVSLGIDPKTPLKEVKKQIKDVYKKINSAFEFL